MAAVPTMFESQIIYLPDGDQTGRPTAAKMKKWAARAIEPAGLAYVGANQLVVYVGPHSRQKLRARPKRKKSLSDIHLDIFPDTLNVEANKLGSRHLLYVTVPKRSQITDMVLAFIAGCICMRCPDCADFRIVSEDKHFENVRELLEELGFSCQMIAPT